jgi:AraC-like DNA-binding protein
VLHVVENMRRISFAECSGRNSQLARHGGLTDDRLVREACISRYHFAPFKAKVGQSPHRYLAGITIDAARRMLETTDQSVAAIGAACGYPASSYFADAFTARYGASPRRLPPPVKPR